MFKHALLLLIAVVAIPGCSASNANEQEAPKVSKPLSFTMKSLSGEDVDLSKYEGKVVLIVIIISIALVSVVAGLDKGVKRLSEINMGLAALLMLPYLFWTICLWLLNLAIWSYNGGPLQHLFWKP